MMRSLFLFDMTFWLYLAALCLYVGYMVARRPSLQLAPAGYPSSGSALGENEWATQIGQVATVVTIFGWVVNSMALFTRAYERMQLSGTFAPWSNQFEAMSYVSWAIILGYVLQYVGHCVEGNDLGEWAGVKRLLGLPYVGISPRWQTGEAGTNQGGTEKK